MEVVFRNSDGAEINAEPQTDISDDVFGMRTYRLTILSDFFKESFPQDTDAEMILTVKSGDSRIDLGRIHIDNVAPTCEIPEEFRSWKWFYGEEERVIRLTNISEVLDESCCKVYDNNREIEFRYSREDGTFEFTLQKGWHDVGVILSDTAGNKLDIAERSRIYIGYLWLYLIGAGAAAGTEAAVGMTVFTLKRIRRNSEG